MIALMLYEGRALKIALYYQLLKDVDGVHIRMRDALHNETWELPVQKSVEAANHALLEYAATLEKIVALASSLD